MALVPLIEKISPESNQLVKKKYTLDDIENHEERQLLSKYRLNIAELKEKKDEKLEDPEIAAGDDENEDEDEIIDADLICKKMIRKRK